MKKRNLSITLFIAAFLLTYTTLCCLYPGGKLALEATPMQRLLVAIRHMAVLKTAISFIIGFLVSLIPTWIKKQK